MRPKAIFLCADPAKIDYVYTCGQRQTVAELCDVMPTLVTADNIGCSDLSQVEVILSTWGMMSLTEAQLDRLPRLKAVFYAAGATDYFARPLLERGIHVVSAWRANAIPVAEFTVAQIILSLKNYFANSAACRSPEAYRAAPNGPGCYGETVALIGDGAISTLVKKRLESYNLRVKVVSSFPERRTVSLEEAFSTAYVVSNHLFNHPSNQRVLTRGLFASMRHGATFINTGRGAQVDEEGMTAVLQSRPDLTALLDVTFPEPPPSGALLYKLPNVHLTSHIAGSLNDEVHRMADYCIEDLRRFIAGEAMVHEVSLAMLEA